MAVLLTTRQLQEYLKVDRITIYRMLNDGRLKGVKIGNQWRFPQSEVDRLLGENSDAEKFESNENPVTDFPIDCVQKIQEIYAGIIGVGAITIALRGESLTNPTYSNPFCKLMLNSTTGRLACQDSWRRIALRSTGEPPFQLCHAGLCYQRSIINLGDEPIAWLVTGQFYINTPSRENSNEKLKQLAEKHNIPFTQLVEAANKIPVLRKYQQEQVQEWTPKVANTIQTILCERSEIMSRLQRISELSSIQTTLLK